MIGWQQWDEYKPVFRQDTDRYGYVLVWSRQAQCVLQTHYGTLGKGAWWMPVPDGPMQVRGNIH